MLNLYLYLYHNPYLAPYWDPTVGVGLTYSITRDIVLTIYIKRMEYKLRTLEINNTKMIINQIKEVLLENII